VVIWYTVLRRRPVAVISTDANPSAARRFGSSYNFRSARGQNQRTLRCICFASSYVVHGRNANKPSIAYDVGVSSLRKGVDIVPMTVFNRLSKHNSAQDSIYGKEHR
jgi:hypothetical protein